jgi:hypothetical protein
MEKWEVVKELPKEIHDYKAEHPSYIPKHIKDTATKFQYNIGSDKWRGLTVVPRKSLNTEEPYLLCTNKGNIKYSSFFLLNGIEVVFYEDTDIIYYYYLDGFENINYSDIIGELYEPNNYPNSERYWILLDNLKSNIEINNEKTFAKFVGYDFTIPTHFGPYTVEPIDHGFKFINEISVLFNEIEHVNYFFKNKKYETYKDALNEYEKEKEKEKAKLSESIEKKPVESSTVTKRGKAFVGKLKYAAVVGTSIFLGAQIAEYITPGVTADVLSKINQQVIDNGSKLISSFISKEVSNELYEKTAAAAASVIPIAKEVVKGTLLTGFSFIKKLLNPTNPMDYESMDYEQTWRNRLEYPMSYPLPPIVITPSPFMGGAQNNDKYYQKYLKYKYKYLQLK